MYRVACRGSHAVYYMTPKGKETKERYQWELRSQYRGEPIQGDITITIVLYFGDRRTHDWDNFHKITMDACNGILWTDDSQIIEAHVTKEYDPENPRTEIYVL